MLPRHADQYLDHVYQISRCCKQCKFQKSSSLRYPKAQDSWSGHAILPSSLYSLLSADHIRQLQQDDSKLHQLLCWVLLSFSKHDDKPWWQVPRSANMEMGNHQNKSASDVKLRAWWQFLSDVTSMTPVLISLTPRCILEMNTVIFCPNLSSLQTSSWQFPHCKTSGLFSIKLRVRTQKYGCSKKVRQTKEMNKRKIDGSDWMNEWMNERKIAGRRQQTDVHSPCLFSMARCKAEIAKSHLKTQSV